MTSERSSAARDALYRTIDSAEPPSLGVLSMHVSLRTERSLWPVAGFTAAYLAAALALTLRRGNAEFLIYIGVLLLLVWVVWNVHKRIELHVATLWALSVWGLAHVAGGLLLVPESWPANEPSRVLYTLWIVPERIKYDHIVHAFGFGVTTWVCWQGIRAALRRTGGNVAPRFGLLVLAAAGGMGFGALNEVIEFVATLVVLETGVGGYTNTGWDLVANLAGAGIAATLIPIFDKGVLQQSRPGR